MKQTHRKQPMQRFVKKPLEQPYDLEFSDELLEEDCRLKNKSEVISTRNK
ncbi:hypothetical protein [Bacillus solimangrovi]|nr:hypothetical protein [Bacillus solimangrovi]